MRPGYSFLAEFAKAPDLLPLQGSLLEPIWDPNGITALCTTIVIIRDFSCTPNYRLERIARFDYINLQPSLLGQYKVVVHWHCLLGYAYSGDLFVRHQLPLLKL